MFSKNGRTSLNKKDEQYFKQLMGSKYLYTFWKMCGVLPIKHSSSGLVTLSYSVFIVSIPIMLTVLALGISSINFNQFEPNFKSSSTTAFIVNWCDFVSLIVQYTCIIVVTGLKCRSKLLEQITSNLFYVDRVLNLNDENQKSNLDRSFILVYSFLVSVVISDALYIKVVECGNFQYLSFYVMCGVQLSFALHYIKTISVVRHRFYVLNKSVIHNIISDKAFFRFRSVTTISSWMIEKGKLTEGGYNTK